MSNNKYKILMVEDDQSIRDFLQTNLESNGYQVLQAGTYKEGMMVFASYIPDVIILDLGLPDKDGVEMIRTVRETSNVPIIVLSARNTENDKVDALDLGANDYMTKPFGTAELLARVRSLLRNKRNSEAEFVQSGKYILRDMSIDFDKRKVFISDVEIKLTQTEYNILVFLANHTGKVMTYSSIIKEIWGMDDDGSVKKLQVNMANIRKKMGSKPGDNRYIINELGVGYRMNDEKE